MKKDGPKKKGLESEIRTLASAKKCRLPGDLFFIHMFYTEFTKGKLLTAKKSLTAGRLLREKRCSEAKREVQNMKKGLTEIVYILDRSGSMSGLEEDTIGGFNSMMEKQKKTGEEAYVSTILFDDKAEVLHDRVSIQKVEKMNDRQYYVRGCTALLDAVGGAIHHIGNVHKYARDEERPEKTIFVITTDGMENASREYSYSKVKRMIEHEREKYGWEFIFIGANIDAAAEAERFGIRRERAVNYMHDSIGTEILYGGISNAVCSAMRAPSKHAMEADLNNCAWDAVIRDDFDKRSKR